MTIVHSLEGAGHDSVSPARRDSDIPASNARPPKSMRPVDMGPQPPAWTRSAKSAERVQISVQATLFLAVTALLGFIGTRPQQARMYVWVEAERSVVELRAIISDYHIEHGAYPGCDANGAATPRWFAHEWERAIARANAQSDAGGVHLKNSNSPGGVPRNPINGLATVRFLSSTDPWPLRADDSTGWVYRPASGEIRANCLGNAFGSGPEYWDL
jgi:hypothetical protein